MTRELYPWIQPNLDQKYLKKMESILNMYKLLSSNYFLKMQYRN